MHHPSLSLVSSKSNQQSGVACIVHDGVMSQKQRNGDDEINKMGVQEKYSCTNKVMLNA